MEHKFENMEAKIDIKISNMETKYKNIKFVKHYFPTTK
jgi:hypothetical protein